MSRVVLLRHARAAWPLPGTRDFDRTLDESGIADASAVGRKMKARGLLPDRVICSGAKRARETWIYMAPRLGLPEEQAVYTDELYTADAAGYAELIRTNAEDGTLLVIGHNPMIEDVAMAFATTDEARAVLARGFAAGGVAVLELEPDGPRVLKGHLESYFAPADI